MRRILLVFAIWFVTLGVGESMFAQAGIRTLLYMFQRGDRLVYVTVAEGAGFSTGTVASTDPSKPGQKHKEREFTLSPAQFNQAWNVITAASVRKYTAGPNPVGKLDLRNSHIFYVSRPQDGEGGTFYIVPKNQASRAVASVAAQFVGYTK